MNPKETGWCGRYWTDLAHERDQQRGLVNMVMKL
jgi:hypothetical protein